MTQQDLDVPECDPTGTQHRESSRDSPRLMILYPGSWSMYPEPLQPIGSNVQFARLHWTHEPFPSARDMMMW